MTSADRFEPLRPFIADERAEPEQLISLRLRLERWLQQSGCDTERVESVLLAANEAISNAIEHAYADTEPGPVHIRGQVLPDGTIRIAVADQGSWRPAQPGGYRGRGILMMQECGDTVRIVRSSYGTVVTLTARPEEQPEPGTAAAAACRDQFQLRRQFTDGHVVAKVTGTVSAGCEAALARELLAASCGGVAPMTIDLTGLSRDTEHARDAIQQTAQAARRVGGSTTLVVNGPHTDVWHRVAEVSEIIHSP